MRSLFIAIAILFTTTVFAEEPAPLKEVSGEMLLFEGWQYFHFFSKFSAPTPGKAIGEIAFHKLKKSEDFINLDHHYMGDKARRYKMQARCSVKYGSFCREIEVKMTDEKTSETVVTCNFRLTYRGERQLAYAIGGEYSSCDREDVIVEVDNDNEFIPDDSVTPKF